jgi:hypothetical protein
VWSGFCFTRAGACNQMLKKALKGQRKELPLQKQRTLTQKVS